MKRYLQEVNNLCLGRKGIGIWLFDSVLSRFSGVSSWRMRRDAARRSGLDEGRRYVAVVCGIGARRLAFDEQ
jgi:hypothetical protein